MNKRGFSRQLCMGWLALATTLPVIAADLVETRLVRQLTGRSEAVRQRTIAGLQSDRPRLRAVLPELVLATEQIADSIEPDDLLPPSVVRLVGLVGSVDDELSEQALIHLLDAEHSGVAMIAADTLGKNRFRGSIDFLKKQIGREEYAANYAFRFNLVRALMQMRDADAIEFVTHLSQSLDGQLRHKVSEILADVTIDDFGGDPDRFRQWLQSKDRATGIFKSNDRQPESLARIKLTKSQYYGIDIHAKRLMFILDRSGSMEDYVGGQSRLDRAKAELIQAIDHLTPKSEFALLFFNSDIGLWRDRLVIASEDNKRAAIQYVRRLRADSFTNTYGALRKALEFDDSLEAVFLLTDGRPTTGALVHPNAIIDDILHRNRFRHLNFSTIGIAVEGPTESFLRTLAEETGGEYRSAN